MRIQTASNESTETAKQVFLSVVSLARNEEDNVESVIRYWLKILEEDGVEGEIVITDGCSTDRTGEILDRLQKTFENLKVIHAASNPGYGGALSMAIAYSSGKYVVSIDSDGQFDLADYRRLFDKLQEGNYDVVTGYRKRKKDSFVKVVADRIMNRIVRYGFGLSLKDTNCALKLFKGDLIRNLQIESRTWSTPTEICIKLDKLGYKQGEAGVEHYDRDKGQPKLMVFRTSWQMLVFLLYLWFKIALFKAKVIHSL